MSQTRLTGLALLHIYYNMDIDFDETIHRFARLQGEYKWQIYCLTELKKPGKGTLGS